MQFRSPTETPIRLALLSGHTALVDHIWRDLPPIFHHEAVLGGCERSVDDGKVPNQVHVQSGEDALGQTVDPDVALRQALTTMLERDEEGDFTADSLPNVNAVKKIVGFNARKEDVLRVFREMKQEAGAGNE